jgi:dinuclear metal center YbgI/SA1388 family protein
LRLGTVTRFLDETLQIASFNSDGALNGLQVEGSKTVTSICLAVDACEDSIRKTFRAGADLLITHHGLFWGTSQAITGPLATRLGLLLTNGISLYAAHLPLDCHPDFGNNARLSQIFGLREIDTFGQYHGVEIGICGILPRTMTPLGVAAKLRRNLGSTVKTFPFGKPKVRKLGIVSGRGAALAPAASEKNCDALLTGETAHEAYHTARESRISLICAGHYATETIGIRALGEHIHRELGMPVRFIDIPTGL